MCAMRPVSVFGIAGAQHERGLGDQLDVLGVGLGQVQRARARRGDRVGRRRGVDGDAVVVQFGRKAFRQPVERGLDRAVDAEARRAIELGERRALRADRRRPTSR